MALTLVLVLAGPVHAQGEAGQKPAVAKPAKGAPPPVQVIRRVTVGGAYPLEGGGKGQPPTAGNNKVNSTAKPAAAVPSIQLRATAVRSNPLRSIPICGTPIRTTRISSTVIRSTPIPSTPGRA